MAAPVFPAGVDFRKASAFALRFENLATAPGTPVTGQAYLDTAGSLNLLKVYNGTAWITLGRLDQLNAPTAAVNMNSQQLQAVLDPTAAQHAATQNYVLTRTVNSFATPTANFAMGGFKITGLGAATVAGDATDKTYVDNAVEAARQGLSLKNPVAAALGTNIVLTGPGATIDGVTMAANDRFLAYGQTTGAENGIYVWTGAATTATRAVDADVFGELQDGTQTWVMAGTLNGDKQYRQTATLTTFGGQTWVAVGTGTTYTFSTGTINTAGTITIDDARQVRKYAVSFGDGVAVSYTITHNLNTQDITAQVREGVAGPFVYPDIAATTVNTCTVSGFITAPTASQYRIAVHG